MDVNIPVAESDDKTQLKERDVRFRSKIKETNRLPPEITVDYFDFLDYPKQ